MKKALVEFIGTFFLVLTIGCTVIAPGVGASAPLAIGAALMVMVYAGGHISGAHYNPAITLAVWIRGKTKAAEAITYWFAQILGALAATFIVRHLKHLDANHELVLSWKSAMAAEALFTFALAWVILNVATAKETASNSYYGAAIGMTVVAGAYAVGSVSGGAFNPAVAIALSSLGLSSWGNLGILISGEVIGAVAAAAAFKCVYAGD